MAVADEIERIQGAKASLKTSINAKTDAQHQITDETIDEYADFVDSIQGGGGDVTITDCSYLFQQNHRLSQMNEILAMCKPIECKGMFNGCSNLATINMNNLDIHNVQDFSVMFMSCGNLQSLDLSFNTFANNVNFDNMFSGCIALETVTFPDETINVSKITQMFYFCNNLVNVNLEKLNISAISKNTDMQNIFQNCSNLSNNSLNSILKMCSTLTGYLSKKTLAYIGLSSAQATTCATLSNWADAQAAGWKTGY